MPAAEGDRIEVRGLRLLGRIGVPEAERATAQPLEIDLDVHLDLRGAGRSDLVTDTVDYGVVVERVVEVVTAGPHALVEAVAELAAETVLALDPRVEAVTVVVRKLRPPVPADVATTGVRIHRRRS